MTKTYFEQVPLESIKATIEAQIPEESADKSVATDCDAKKTVRSGRKTNSQAGGTQ
jgi:hypothetical protein